MSLVFAGIVTAIYACAVVIVNQLSKMEFGAGVVAVAVTIDLVVVVPLAFYFLVVRRRGLSIVTLVPVLALSMLAASRVLPTDRQQALHVLEALALPAEVALLGWIGWRAARALREARAEPMLDPLAQLRRAAFELTRNDRAAEVVGLGSWRSRAHAPAGSSAFSQHLRSGHAAMMLALILLLAVEGLAVHFLLHHWSVLAAWICTIGSAYGALWLIADYRATVLRPILVSDESILFRAGFRCTVQVPLDRIAGVSRNKPQLTLSEPMVAEGPYGLRRRVRAIGIAPDAADEFDRMLDRSV